LVSHLLLGYESGDVLGIGLNKGMGFSEGIEEAFEEIIVICLYFLADTSQICGGFFEEGMNVGAKGIEFGSGEVG
jgi:hypothetical protein